jgi:hypothetical protein
MPSSGYLSDPDLVYVPELGELWMYYRQVDTQNRILLVRSTNGVTWGAPVPVASAPNHALISPAVVHRAPGDWLMWSVNGGPKGCADTRAFVELRRSRDGIAWSAPESLSIAQRAMMPWHIEVQWIPSRGEFWALYNVKDAGSCATPALYLATSPDGVHWTTYPSPVLARGALPDLATIVYRSTFDYDPATDEIRFWYSGATWADEQWTWRTAFQRRTRAEVFASIGRSGTAASRVRTARDVPAIVEWP